MKNIVINLAYRFGNFCQQIKNAIHIAVFYNYNVILPPHDFLKTRYIVLNKEVTIKNEQLTNKDQYLYKNKIQNIDKSLFNKNQDIVNYIFKTILVFSTDTVSLGNNDLVIHIRSGDLFDIPNPHEGYLVPPLSYYKKIIDENKYYENIYLIAEDRLNPCIDKLLEIYPNIKFKLQSLQEDITLILSAVNVVISFGTFVPQILYLSKNIKTVYCPSYYNVKIPNCVTHISELKEYYKLMIPWKNTPEQNKQLLDM